MLVANPGIITLLNVLRTITKRMLHLQLKTLFIELTNYTVDTITPSRFKFDTLHAERQTLLYIVTGRIFRRWHRFYAQTTRLR